MRVIIADSDRDFCELLCARLSVQMPAAQVDCASDGLVLLNRIPEICPDLVVVNLLLSGKDGLESIKAIRGMSLYRQPAIMVLASYMTPLIHQELYRLNVAYYTAMPCELSALAQSIQTCCRELVYRSASVNETDEVRVVRVLRDLGLTMNCKGFRYIRYGLEWMKDRPEHDVSITKELYPAIAAHFQTTSANVERAIRSAIMSAWQKEGYLKQRELFLQRPTNGEFFAVLDEKFRLERRCAGIE